MIVWEGKEQQVNKFIPYNFHKPDFAYEATATLALFHAQYQRENTYKKQTGWKSMMLATLSTISWRFGA